MSWPDGLSTPVAGSGKVFLSYKWKQSGHINVLEAVAVLDLLRKLARSPSEGSVEALFVS